MRKQAYGIGLLVLLLGGCGTAGLGDVTDAGTAGTATSITSSADNPTTTLARGETQPPPPPPPPPGESFEARTIDGTANHGDNAGSAATNFLRQAPNGYADGLGEPAGADRAGAREISNAVVAQSGEVADPNARSAFVWAWGQFIDHDLDLTFDDGQNSFPIAVPTGDPYFDPAGTGTVTIPFSRAMYDPGSVPHQLVNHITSFLDASQVYGSDDDTAAGLRSFSGGLLKTSEGNLPPLDEAGFFMAGDVRANENVVLTSLHTLFLREHNRVARQLAAQNPNLSDEQLYQRARKQVGALIEVITYQEFLPSILGPDALPAYNGYQSGVNPSISLEFAAAAYRLGHSQVGPTIQRLGPDGSPIAEGNLSIAEAFFVPQLLIDEGGIEPILRGLPVTTQQRTDNQVIDGLRNFLFGPPGAGGLDLASLNLQRGRDVGLPDYNTLRRSYGLRPVTSFSQMTRDTQRQLALASVYSSPDQVDPWIGMLSEDPVPGAAVGPTLRAILVDQFRRTRDGDRFWYRNDPYLAPMVANLEGTHLTDVIARNTNVRLNGNPFTNGAGTRPAPPREPRRRPRADQPPPSL